MQSTQAHPAAARRARRWIILGWMLILALAITTRAPQPASATHRSPTLHNWYIHYGDGDGTVNGIYDEDYCVKSHNTAYMSDATLAARAYESYNQASPRWDGTGGWRIDMWKASGSCSDYANTDWIEVELHMSKNNADNPNKWCSENYSCVSHYTAVWSSQYSHNHYKWEWIHVDYDNINGDYTVYRKLFNHEMGHVWGLLDGDGSCPGSLMHNEWYGCTNWYNWYPSTGDFNSVVAGMG